MQRRLNHHLPQANNNRPRGVVPLRASYHGLDGTPINVDLNLYDRVDRDKLTNLAIWASHNGVTVCLFAPE